MMGQILLKMCETVWTDIWSHLLPKRFVVEEAAFMFVRREMKNEDEIFEYLDWFPVPPKGFLTRSGYHFELTDEIRARGIKQAHDLNASLVELHSHKGRRPAQFSSSDLLGFREFVPHVLWRLKGRPYLAVVVSRSGFDGLVWMVNPGDPHHLDGILTEKTVLKPTKLSHFRDDYYDERTI
jgi:hypothetical protein